MHSERFESLDTLILQQLKIGRHSLNGLMMNREVRLAAEGCRQPDGWESARGITGRRLQALRKKGRVFCDGQVWSTPKEPSNAQ